jgi:hypothetical protein
VYVSSLAPNKKRNQNHPYIFPLILLRVYSSLEFRKKSSIRIFSSQTFFIIVIIILIFTMLAISFQGFNPQQSMASSY